MTEFLTIDELSGKLKVHKGQLYLFARKGKIPGAFKFGKYWRFRKDMVDQWIEEQTKPRAHVKA